MKFISLLILLAYVLHSGAHPMPDPAGADTTFWQEYHEPYPVGNAPGENEVRSIAADAQSSIWIATKAGVYVKQRERSEWSSPFSKRDKGPAYAVAADGQSGVWMGTWNGVFNFRNNHLTSIPGTEGPIAAICVAKEGIYAAGSGNIWLFDGTRFIKKPYAVARSVRAIISDGKAGIWVATDVGLYHSNAQTTAYYHSTDMLISAYVKGIALDASQKLWAGGLGGVSILENGMKERVINPEQGCPSIYVNAVKKAPDGTMWIGTDMGVVRYAPGGGHTLRFSRRWLLDDRVSDIAFDKDGNAWVATAQGVSAIRKRKMNLAQKQDYFYDVLMKRHIRDPWIAGQCHLSIPGDTASWEPEDDDNDGEYTGNYLAMECFRYAVTKNPDAREKANKAFGFLKLLQEVTGTDGFFARTIVPASRGNRVHDTNRIYSPREKAEELVKDPRFKPVEMRWRKSKNGKWIWKGDTSSDEMCGHMMGYFFYYELVADEAEKQVVRRHVARIVDYLIAHKFNMVDIDGLPTHWSVWSPEQLNRDPEWMPDRNQNSMELLTFLKLAYHMTADEKYQDHYLHLINEEHYLDNMSGVIHQNPAWFIYFDVTLQAYLYPILLGCEKDPRLLDFYKDHIEKWMNKRRGDRNPLINFIYCFATNKKEELAPSMDFLQDTPLDLVNWRIDHTRREDIKLVHQPVLDDLQVDVLPPASIRSVVRWDKNPWTAVDGSPDTEREPVFWLLPYWMGRYLKMIP